MSATIALIKFFPDEDGRICEDASQTISNFHISTDVLNELMDKYGTVSRSILEEFDSSDESEYEVFEDGHGVRTLITSYWDGVWQ